MVFSINPTTDKTHAMFQGLAIQQRGNGAQSAIVGGPPAAPVGAPPAGAVPPANAPVAAAPVGTAPGAPLASGVFGGTGTIGSNGECNCAVVCQFDQNSAFPAQAQGAGAFGGIPGMFFSSFITVSRLTSTNQVVYPWRLSPVLLP